MRRALTLGLLLALTVPTLAAPPVQAQVEPSCRAPILTLARLPTDFVPGSTQRVRFAVENPNHPPIDAVAVSLTTTAPAGWTASLPRREFTMAAREVAFDELAITAPNRGTGAGSGNITVHVTLVCDHGDFQTAAAHDQTIDVRLTSFETPWPVFVAAFGVLAFAVGALGLRRVRRGVAVVARPARRAVHPGASVKFEFVVENRRGRPARFHMLAAGLPDAWTAHLALEEVVLEPGEEKALWAIVRAPEDAEPGQSVSFTIHLESAIATRDRAFAELTVDVKDSP